LCELDYQDYREHREKSKSKNMEDYHNLRPKTGISPEVFIAMRINFGYIAKGIFAEANLLTRATKNSITSVLSLPPLDVILSSILFNIVFS
jgi:predicted ABC-type sugar transport system permease subunit